MAIEIALVGPERHGEFVMPLLTAFGLQPDPERAARVQRLPEVLHRVAALEDGRIVGGAGSYRFEMTTPGGRVPTAGLTMVGVLPTHRRRGVLTGMMRRHFDEARAAGLPLAALWASEGMIYGRFGYGIASLCGSITLARDRAVFRRPVARDGSFRLVDQAVAAATFPGIWDRVRPGVPGMPSRSDVWWEIRRLGDHDKGAPPLQRVLLEIDGSPEGYALYRFSERLGVPGILEGDVSVMEALATSPKATAVLWRYLCDLDLVRHLKAMCLPPTHPIFHLVREPRRLRMTLEDALWVRLIDAGAALAARRWESDERLTFALDDAFCPWNSGVYAIDGKTGSVTRDHGAPELRLDASALGGLYLGGITATQLADAGDIAEASGDALGRADRLFRSPRAPWCPEIF